MRILTKLKNSTLGAGLVEYGALVGLIAVAAMGAVLNLGGTVDETFSDVEGVLSAQGIAGETQGIGEQDSPSQSVPTPITICTNGGAWAGDGSGGYIGFDMYNTRAIYFGTSPAPAATPNGGIYNIVFIDSNGDGLLQETEANAGIYPDGADPATWYAGPTYLVSRDLAFPNDIAGSYSATHFPDDGGGLVQGDQLTPVINSPSWPFDLNQINDSGLSC